MTYRMRHYHDSEFILVALAILAVILGAYVARKLIRHYFSSPLPSGPAALGRGFAVVLIGFPLTFGAAWLLTTLLSAIFHARLINLISFEYVIISLLMPVVAGSVAARSRENVGFMNGCILAGAGLIPYALLSSVLALRFSDELWWLPMALYVPLVLAGARFFKNTDDNLSSPA